MLMPLLRAALVAQFLPSGLAFSASRLAFSSALSRQFTVGTTTSMSAAASSSSSSTTEEKQIIFVRHSITHMNEYLSRGLSFGAPGFTDVFSEKERSEKYQDSPLSPSGIKLVKMELASRRPDFMDDDDIDLVVVSPLRRALQTYDLGLRRHLPGTPVVALPHAAERLYLISDVGSPVSELQKDFPYVDFDEISDPTQPWWWTPTAGAYTEWRPMGRRQRYACPGEPAADFSARMQRLQEWLERRPEQKIVVVCHHGVIDWMIDMDFDNCQYRQVPFSKVSPACLAEYE